ncbi:hypothetical protein ACB092_11G075200 [Castanea dentata]
MVAFFYQRLCKSWETIRRKKPPMKYELVEAYLILLLLFLSILYMLDCYRLPTRRDCMASGVYQGHMLCFFCRSKIKLCDHPYFECSLSNRICASMLKKCLYCCPILE